MLQADDGGYFIAGGTGLSEGPDPQEDVYLIRTDAEGETLWEKTYGGAEHDTGTAMIQASDGNLVIAGGTSSLGAGEIDMYLLKVDQDGNEIWSKTYGGVQDEQVVDVHQTQDGGYILIGYTRIAGSEGDIEAAGNIGAGESDVYLVRTDGQGNELWAQVYTGENGEPLFTSAGLPTPDGGFLVLARINPNTDHNTFLLKVDADGQKLWSRAWETENLRAGNDIIPTSDGAYLIVGLSEAPDGRGSFMLIKVDSEGNELWVNVIDNQLFSYTRTAIESPDGGFIVVGFSGQEPLIGAEIFQVDENGQLLWTENLASHRLFHANSILPHPDGGYIVTGETTAARGVCDVFLTRIQTPSPVPLEASNTNNTWTKTYGGSSDVHVGEVLLADDGGYFILGTTDIEFEPEMKGDFYLVRTDAAGEVLWEKTYGGPGYERGGTIYRAADGGLMLAGVTTSFGAVGTDAYLVKVDQEGNELWSKTFGGPLDEMATAWQLPDGGFMVGGNVVDPNDPVVDDPGAAGYGGFAGRSNIYLSRTDSEGNELWSRTFGGENNVLATSAVPTDDGGFVILATVVYYPEGGDDIYLLKVDQDGNEVWSYTWEQASTNAYEVVEAADGGYLISASFSTSDDPRSPEADYLFIKVDAQGNELWSNIFGDPDMVDYGQVLAATDDGGFVAAGELVRDLYSWDADTALVRLDENGRLLWQQVFDTSTHSMFTTLFQHPDGGYVIAGASYTGRVFNIFLTKTDADGNVEAAEAAE